MRFILFVVLGFSLCGHTSERGLQPWQGYSDPGIMNSSFSRKFSALPLVAQVTDKKKYWSSDYWPLFEGNINYRWNSPHHEGFNLRSPTYREVWSMSLDELKALAPSEKYDLFIGNYRYPLKRQVAAFVSPDISEWQGICHGWAAASLNHNEPAPKVMTNPDGLQVPFGSSDIKALLSYYYAYYYEPESTYQMGRRCDGESYCGDDLNAGAFHIVLANKVGLQGTGFIADIDNGTEVWNQVVYSYKTTVVSGNLPPARNSAKNTVKVVRLKTRVTVVFNIVSNSWWPVIGTNLQTYKDLDYEYDLDLDAGGNIIGGDWRSTVRPDFIWTAPLETEFWGLFYRLGELL